MGQQGEEHRFLGGAVESERFDRDDGDWREEIAQDPHEGGVAGATAAHDDLVDRWEPAPVGLRDRVSGEGRDGGDEVTGSLAERRWDVRIAEDASGKTELVQKLSGERQTVALATRRFGRGLIEEGIGQQVLEKHAIDAPLGGECPVSVAVELSGGQELDDAVDHHVPGTGIESENVLARGTRWKVRDVADATDILDGTVARRMTQDDPVEVWCQRSPLPTRSHISGSEIGDDRHASALRDDRWIADLERSPGSERQERAGRWLVPNRLSVRADHEDLVQRATSCPAEGHRCLGEQLTEDDVERTESFEYRRCLLEELEKFSPHEGWERSGSVGEKVQLCLRPGTPDADEGGIDRVCGGAGEQTDTETVAR